MIRKKIGRKFFVEQNPKTFVEKKLVEICGWPKFFLIEFFSSKFSMTFFSIKNIFRPTKNFDQMFFRQKFSDFFRRKIFDQKIFGSHIPIPNDPKIPKITLRTAYDHYKNTNSAHEKKLLFSPSICNLDRPDGTRFANLLYNNCRTQGNSARSSAE